MRGWINWQCVPTNFVALYPPRVIMVVICETNRIGGFASLFILWVVEDMLRRRRCKKCLYHRRRRFFSFSVDSGGGEEMAFTKVLRRDSCWGMGRLLNYVPIYPYNSYCLLSCRKLLSWGMNWMMMTTGSPWRRVKEGIFRKPLIFSLLLSVWRQVNIRVHTICH